MEPDILAKIAEARRQEQKETWNKMTTDQKRSVIEFQGRLNLVALSYAKANSRCKACSGPAYKATKVAGESVTVIACGACKYVQSSNTLGD